MGGKHGHAALYHVKKAGTVEVGDVGGDAEPSHIGNEPFAERFKPFFDVVLAPEGYFVFVVPCQGYQLYAVFKSGLCSPSNANGDAPSQASRAAHLPSELIRFMSEFR